MITQKYSQLNIIKRIVNIFSVIFFIVFVQGCASFTAENKAEANLKMALGRSGYSLFTPFRSGDYPGTIFIYARDQLGATKEFTVSPWNKTFVAQPGDLFPVDGERVAVLDELKDNYSIQGDLALSLLKPVLDLSSLGSNLVNVTISFGHDQKKHVMPIAKLTEYRTRLQPDTRATLLIFKKNKQLGQSFIIMETLTVSSINVTVDIKRGAEGSINAKKFEELGVAKASVAAIGTHGYSIGVSAPVIIGYKALAIPDTLLSELSSAKDISGLVLTPDEVDKIKAQ